MGLIADFIYVSDIFDNQYQPHSLYGQLYKGPLYTDQFIQEIKPIVNISKSDEGVDYFDVKPSQWCNWIHNTFSYFTFRCGIFPIISGFSVNLFEEWDPQIQNEIDTKKSSFKLNTVRWWLEFHIKRIDNPYSIFWRMSWAKYHKELWEDEEYEYRRDQIYDENGYAREDNCKEEYTVNNLFLGEILMNKKRWL